MKIYVLVKTIPKKILKNGLNISPRNESACSINPYDLNAIEEALRIKDKIGAEIIALSLGSANSKNALQYLSALGVDETILITDESFRGSDTFATASIFKRYFEIHDDFDLIICGQMSSDGSTSQVPIELASMLNLEFSINVKYCEVSRNVIKCGVEYEDYYVKRCHSYPALISVTKDMNTPRLPSIDGLLNAKEKKINIIGNKELKIKESYCGIEGSRTQVVEMAKSEKEKIKQPVNYNEPKDFDIHFRDIFNVSNVKKSQNIVVERRKHDDGKTIVSLCEVKGNRIKQSSEEIVNLALGLAQEWNAKLVTISYGNTINVYDELVKQLSLKGVNENYYISIDDVKKVESRKIADEIIKCLYEVKPNVILIPSTVMGKELAAYIAAKTESGLTADCIDISIRDNKLIQTRPVFGGEYTAVIESKQSCYDMATVKMDIGGISYKVCDVQTQNRIWPCNVQSRTEWEYTEHEENITLKNEIVFGIGDGVKRKEYVDLIKEYCRRHSFGICATRRIVDKGYFDYKYQVGMTGKIISPEIYVAIGISGAVEHAVGIKNSKKIISINNDNKAPICNISDYIFNVGVEEFINYLKENCENEQ